MAKNCKGCKYYIFKKCRKGHILPLFLPIICKHFEKLEPYVERFTKCDKCESLKECQESRRVIDVSILEDNYNHYMCSMGSVCKKEAEVSLWNNS